MILIQKLLTLVVVGVVCGEGLYQGDYTLPVMVFDEGDIALIPCIKEANENDYFWSRGKWYNNGTNIAYIARGIPSKSNKYDVYIDGTLVIHRTSLDDEGNYFCRILSDSTESYMGVRILIRVNSRSLDIAIWGCNSSSSCIKILEPSLEFSLTCTANMRSESMTLKWYNGSKEIIGNVDVSEISGQKVKITNIITFMFEDESYLTCEAEGVNLAKSMAAIQLKKKEAEKEATLTLLVPTIVLGIICLIVTCILIYLTIRNRKRNKRQGKAKDGHIAEMDHKGEQPGNDMEHQNGEETPFITPKEENATDLAKTQKELHTPKEENATDLAKTEKELQELQTEMKETKKALEERDRELLLAKQSLKKREIEQLQGTGKHKVKLNSTVENLQKDLQEANHKILAAEEEKKNLKKDLEDTRRKLATAAATEKNLQKELEDTRKKLVTAETTEKNLQGELKDTRNKLAATATAGKKELEDTRKKLATAETSEKNLQRQLEDTRKKLATAETTEKKQQEELKVEKNKLSSYETTIQIILKNIIEMKDKTLRNLPESSPTVIISVKGVLPKESYGHADVLPKHKYRDVSLVSGPSCNGDIFDKMKDKVEACFSGRNTTMFLFGRFESGLHHTLHGEKENKGLIARVVHQTFFLSNQLRKDGFQVNIDVTVASVVVQGKFLKFLSPSDPPIGTDKFRIASGSEIILNKYHVQSEQSLFKIASFMTPTRSNPISDGLLKITVETLVGPTTVSKGCFIIASISNLVKVPKILKGKPEDNFGELLFLLTRSIKSDLVLIPKVDPTLECEPRKTFGAVKTALDDYR